MPLQTPLLLYKLGLRGCSLHGFVNIMGRPEGFSTNHADVPAVLCLDQGKYARRKPLPLMSCRYFSLFLLQYPLLALSLVHHFWVVVDYNEDIYNFFRCPPPRSGQLSS